MDVRNRARYHPAVSDLTPSPTRVIALLLACAAMLTGATPLLSRTVPVGTFQEWLSFKKAPLVFASGGLTVKVEALPCTVAPHADDSTCAEEGYNNQAGLTVTGPGMAPFHTQTDRQASFIRVAAVRLDQRDARPGLVVDNQYGGSGGILTIFMLVPDGAGFRRVDIVSDGWIEGQIADGVTDLSGDGRADFVLEDARFDSVFGCNACAPRPPMVLTIEDGRSVDLSRDPAVRPIFARHLVGVRATCLSSHPDRNGACAAYVADAARLGLFRQAWAEMLVHYDKGERDWLDRCPAPSAGKVCPSGYGKSFRSFPEALHTFLERTGYLT